MGTDTRGVSWSAALRAALDRSGEISYSSMFQIKPGNKHRWTGWTGFGTDEQTRKNGSPLTAYFSSRRLAVVKKKQKKKPRMNANGRQKFYPQISQMSADGSFFSSAHISGTLGQRDGGAGRGECVPGVRGQDAGRPGRGSCGCGCCARACRRIRAFTRCNTTGSRIPQLILQRMRSSSCGRNTEN